jgi:hypothetical protein
MENDYSPPTIKAVNAQRRRSHGAAELEIIRNLGDVEEHFFQIAGYRDFFDRVGELSAGDP